MSYVPNARLEEKAEYDFGLLRDTRVWDFQKRLKIWEKFRLNDKEIDYLFVTGGANSTVRSSINIHPKLTISSIEGYYNNYLSLQKNSFTYSHREFLAGLVHSRTFFPKNDDLLEYFIKFDYGEIINDIAYKFVYEELDYHQMDIFWRYLDGESRKVLLERKRFELPNWMLMEAYIQLGQEFYAGSSLLIEAYLKNVGGNPAPFEYYFKQHCQSLLGKKINVETIPSDWLIELLDACGYRRDISSIVYR